MTDNNLPPVLSRKEAVALGLKRYFTGEPCKHGHIAERSVRGGCLMCRRERSCEHRAVHLEKVREQDRKSARKRRAADPEKARENSRRWRARNPQYLEAQRERYAKNRDKILSKQAANRAAKNRSKARSTSGAPNNSANRR